MKTINVVAAIIYEGDKILATQRGYGDFKGKWEFPGGKIESGETSEKALKREIYEELNAKISIEKYICTIEYDYSNFHLSMQCYMCSLLDGKIELKEHINAKWITREELYQLDWLPADVKLVECLIKNI